MKTVMRNEYRDAAAEKKRIQNREAKPDLMNVLEIEDVYPSEHFILDNEKYRNRQPHPNVDSALKKR